VQAHVGDGAEPVAALAVEVIQAGKSAAVEKTRAHVADRALDLAFGSRPIGPAAFGFETVMPAKVEEAGVGAVRSDDDLPHVAVEDALGPTTEESESVLVTADQRRERHGTCELDVEIPRVAQDHHEGIDLDRGAVGLRVAANLGPVALGLLTWRCLETHGQLGIDAMLGPPRLQEAAHDFE